MSAPPKLTPLWKTEAKVVGGLALAALAAWLAYGYVQAQERRQCVDSVLSTTMAYARGPKDALSKEQLDALLARVCGR